MEIKKIAVLTSGGDSQGMSKIVLSVIKACYRANIEPYIVKDGYYGLYNDDITLAPAVLPSEYSIARDGGTYIGTSRFPDFQQPAFKDQAVENLRKRGISGLVVAGGNGSFAGALPLHSRGIGCVGIPATIDNDVDTSDFTIGFDTTANVIMQELDRLRNTCESHHRCVVVEAMGRHCGDLVLYAGVAAGADLIVTSDNLLTKAEIVRQVQMLEKQNKRSVIVLVTENLFDVNGLAAKIGSATHYVTRASVLGHLQRGGSPTVRDRFYACLMGIKAVALLQAGTSGVAIALKGMELVEYPMDAAANHKTLLHKTYYQMYEKKLHKG